MTLLDFYKAEELVCNLRTADQNIDDARLRLGVTLAGKYHDDVADEVRHHVVRVLEGRRAAIVNNLATLGVEV